MKQLKLPSVQDLRKQNIAVLEETVGWSYNGVLTSIQIKRRGRGWQVLLKVDFPDGPHIAYIRADTYAQACEKAALHTDSADLSFWPDTYPIDYDKGPSVF